MANNTALRLVPGRSGQPIPTTAARQPEEPALIKTTCSTCKLRELCTPCCGLSRSEINDSTRLLFARLRIRRGENLYLAGDRFTSLYAVRKGFLKTTAILAKGRDQVTGFSMTGEVLGMDGIEAQRHGCNTIALEDGEICAISFARLQELTLAIPSLQRHFHAMMSREIVREHGVMLLLGSMSAEERMAMFLLDFSRRFAAQGGTASEFNLRLTRENIGSYLSLTVGTVSRLFARFRESGLIAVRQKLVRIVDRGKLECVIGRSTRSGTAATTGTKKRESHWTHCNDRVRFSK